MLARQRVLLVLLSFLVLLVFGFIAALVFIEWRSRAAWAEAEAETDRLDPDWRLAAIPEWEFDPIAAEADSALLIRDVAREMPIDRIGASVEKSKLFTNYPPNVRYSDEQVAVIEKALAPFREMVQRARQLKDMPRGRLGGPGDQIADWLRHDALLAAQEAQIQLAVEECLAMLNARRCNDDNVSLLHIVNGLAAYELTVETLERALAQGVAPNHTLRTIQSAFTEEVKKNTLLRGARGQRAYDYEKFNNVRTGKRPSSDIAFESNLWFHRQFPTSVLRHYPERLNQANQLVEVAKLPIHERSEKLAVLKKSFADSGNPIALGSHEYHHWHDQKAHGLLRATVAALASERYRLANKSWPANLDVLVKERYLPEMLTDPFDGAPLRLFATTDGIVFYSIGKNAIDEQGKMTRHGIAGAGDDLGFRLWDERFRGLPPLAPDERKNPK